MEFEYSYEIWIFMVLICFKLFCFYVSTNTFGPNVYVWQQRYGSTLSQVIACYLTSPSHYLNQCWLWDYWHPSQCNFTAWCHQMETFSALLALCAGNSQVTGEFPTQKPVTWSFDVFFDLCLNKRLSKHRDIGDLRCYHAHYDVTVMENS